MEYFVTLPMIYLLILFSFNGGHANQTPKYIEDLFAEASKITSNPYKSPAENLSCDYIIIGAGTAGCALANRLSANPNTTVCLFESGGPESEVHQMPVFSIALQATPSNYGYNTVPQNNSCFAMNDNSCGVPQGKSLGGSSSINYSIYNRGDRKSYDDWAAAAGSDEWMYDNVLPYFLRAENASALVKYSNSPYHNSSGSYISTEFVKYRTSISSAFIQACHEADLKDIDYNNPDSEEGCSYTQANTRNGRRDSAFKAYIESVQADRPNLHVFPFTLVTKILIDPQTKTAYGVEFEHAEVKSKIRANKEVILSAGPFHSPQLLIVSGIGPSQTLEEIKVPQIVDLPVGQTLYDHGSNIGPICTANTTSQTLFLDRATPFDIANFEAGDPGTIVSSISGIEGSAYMVTTEDEVTRRNIELIMVAATLAVDYGTVFRSSLNMRLDAYNKYFKDLEGKEHWGFLITALHPKSKGNVTVVSSDVKVPPKVNPNYFSRQEDIEVTLKGIKKALEIISLPGMQAINATLVRTKVPGCEKYEFGCDDYWRCAMIHFTFPLHHHSGTCKMGPASDETSVVDHEFRVHGVKNLRVVDTCVIPITIAGHLAAIAYMIGEKAADIITLGKSE